MSNHCMTKPGKECQAGMEDYSPGLGERNYYQDGAILPIHLSSNCFSYAEVVNYFNELMTFHGVFYEKEMNLECEEGALFGEVRSHGIKELGVLGIKDI